jgi:hypothetical protein
MTKAEEEAVQRFKHAYPELCRGKTDQAILIRAKFVEAVRKEIRKERARMKTARKPHLACLYGHGVALMAAGTFI